MKSIMRNMDIIESFQDRFKHPGPKLITIKCLLYDYSLVFCNRFLWSTKVFSCHRFFSPSLYTLFRSVPPVSLIISYLWRLLHWISLFLMVDQPADSCLVQLHALNRSFRAKFDAKFFRDSTKNL